MAERKNGPILAVTALAVVVGCVLAWSTGKVNAERMWDLRRNVVLLASALHLPIGVVLAVGATCYARTRRSGILWLTLIAVAIFGAVSALMAFQSGASLTPGTWNYALEYILTYLTRTSTAVPLILLLSVQFQGQWERLRVACLALMGALFVCEMVATVSMTIRWLYYTAIALEAVFLVAVILALAGAGWALAFRQAERKRSGSAEEKKMGLTCPRCGLTQELSVAGGECAGCRLGIFVTLEAGACSTCGRSLNGVAGENCPTCGTAIVTAKPQ